MKEDQKRSVMILIGIITLLQILSQYIRYSECTDLGGDSRCVVRSSLIGAGNFGYAYSIFEITTTFLLIMSLQLAYKKSPKLFALITSIFILKISRILLVFLAEIINSDYFQDSLKFSLGYAWRFNNWGNYEFVLNPVLLTSNIAIPVLLIILMVRTRVRVETLKSDFSNHTVDLESTMTSVSPKVAAGWYPNPLANNAVMYWDGSQWLNIPAPTQISTSTESSGLAIAAFVTAFFVPILPIIFGHISLSQINRSNGRISGKGLAIAGLVLGYVALVGWIFLFIGMVVANNYMYSDY